MLRMKPLILLGFIISVLLFPVRSWSAITDTYEKLIVPAGEYYTLGGTRTYIQSVEVFGTLYVKAYNATAGSGYLELIAPNITIATTGKIDAGGRGFRGGAGVYNRGEGPGGGGCGSNGGGAAYGGESIGAVSYGSITNPNEMGSGGGGGNGGAGGGSGGGKIKITATEILINSGTINANGNIGGHSDVLGNGGGGGSGGCIYIEAKVLTGSGTITANGGSGDPITSSAGGGAGGRIAVFYQTDNFTGTITAYANKYYYGTPSGAGSIYRKSAAQTYGNLTISNNGKSGEKTYITGQFDTVTVSSCAITVATTTIIISNLNVNNYGVFYSSTSLTLQILNINNNGTLYVQKEQLSVGDTCNINSAKLYANCPVVINDLKIQSGGILTHSRSDPDFDVKILHNLDILPGGKIDANGCGYIGGTYLNSGKGGGPGGGGAAWCYGGGGGYGGNGATGVARPGIPGGTGGEMYGSSLEPVEMGSGGGAGGGNDTPGGDGGGKIKLLVSGTLSNNGSISANGLNGGLGTSSGYSGGGGAGGCINILASILSGNGTISANGGNAGNSSGGGGAGGRIAISCNNFTFSGNIETRAGTGGATSAGAGSIITPLTNPDPTVNQSDTSVNYLQSSSLKETVSIQSSEYMLNVTGNLSGTMNFADAKMTTIRTGAFSNKGFLKASWNGQLEGVNYTGLLKAAVYLDVKQRKLYVKGAIEGSIKGAIDGYLVESSPQSGTYDQFVATWTFKYPLPGGQYSCGRSALQGTCTCSQNQEYEDVNLKYIQTSSKGSISGGCSSSINAILTNVEISDTLCPNNGEGFCMIAYQTATDEGESWCFSKTLINNESELSGMITNPLYGFLQGTLLTGETDQRLWLVISRIDLGLETKPDLKVRLMALEKVSSGQTITYTMRVRNEGLVPAKDIKMQLSLPLEARFLGASGDYYYEGGGESEWMMYDDPNIYPEWVSWYLDELPAQSERFYNVQAKMLWGLSGQKALNAHAILSIYDSSLDQ